MEGEEKSFGSKKRSKVIPLGFGSCDDETIGSLFKLKNKKIPKKKPVVVVEEDLGGLDDTLASLKKKLKGPKRGVLGSNVSDLSSQLVSVSENKGDLGTGMKELGKVIDKDGLNAKKKAKRVKKAKKNNDHVNENEGSDVSDLSGKPVNGFENDEDLKSETKELKKVIDVDVLNAATNDEVENKDKVNRSKSVKKVKKDKDNGNQRSKTRPTRIKKVRDFRLDSDLNDNLEDSLSVLLRKAQSGLVKKSGIKSKTKQKRKTQTLEVGERLDDPPKDLCIVDDKEESSSRGVSENPQEFDDIATSSTLGPENLIRLSQNSDEHIENTSTLIDMDAKLVSSIDKNEDPHTVSSIERPLFKFNGCSHKDSKSDEGVINKEASKDFGLAQPQSDFAECFDIGKSEGKISDHLETNHFVQNRELRTIEEETCSDHDGCDPLSQSVPNDESNGASSLTVSPDRCRNYKEVKTLKSKEKKLSELFKRKSKKRRHDDMAYEGDNDWDVLTQEQGFAQLRFVEDDDLSLTENVRAAAVSAGLKAHEVGPIEKIKFKDVLKRKGGHQEYLKCRNQILDLWSKDVTRVLPLTECGDDSLTREIYEFLNRSGYINAGIASDKDVTKLSTEHNLKLVEAETFEEKADTDEGVCFILGQYKTSEVPTADNSNKILDDNNQIEMVREEMELDTPQTDELQKERDNEENVERKTEPTSDFSAVHSLSKEGDNGMDYVSDEKRRVIVIGAGPAGLTAARHLQRHGFSVDVLEARERIGGRVYTDKSSLSVPVDLGASIITGVEADVASERRADPSALICAQLGLELTVLKSNCPLYDVVTGQKVPTDLDENLEAEYNSLLDDVLLLVAQRGEKAMKMSLEDGLEYALKSRRKNYVKNEISSKDDVLSPLERRVMNWHFAHLEYGCAALLQDVSLPYWNQDDIYGGFGGAHCMIKGGYSAVVESMGKGLDINLNQIVTNITYGKGKKVKVYTSDGKEFSGDVVLVTVPLGCLKARDIEFSPPLPYWKELSIQRLGFGVLNKVVMEFPTVFWDETVDYFGATAEETDLRGKCFMFWNVKKTVGANILIALVVGKAAIEGQKIDSSDDLVNHALVILRKLFGKSLVPDPVGSVVTDWGNDPFSYGAYSYVSIGSSGEDYDILGKPVENCLFFAGEATCKEYPDTVGGAMLSGLREAVRIIDLLITGNDYTVEVEALEAIQRRSESERTEVRDIAKRLEAIELSNTIYKNSLEGARTFTRKSLLKDMFYCKTKSIAGRLLLAKELLSLPVEALKSFAGTKAGLGILNTWILDSMGKDGTQLLRHCVRLLVLVSTDLSAVRMSGVGKTIKEKVCVHTSRDIRAVASQLVNVWIEVFRKEKASNSGLKLSRKSNNKRSHLPPTANNKKIGKPVKLDMETDLKTEFKSSKSQGSVGGEDKNGEMDMYCVMSEEEKAAIAAAETARAAALAAAEAYASSEAQCNTSLPLPKIPSFHKFTRREQYIHMDDFDVRKKCSEGTSGRQDCISETDSRNCRVRDWSVAFPAAYADLENTINTNNNSSADIISQRSHSPGSAAVDVDANIYTKAWVDGCGSDGLKDYNAIDRWQSQAEAAESDFYHQNIVLRDEEDSNVTLKPHFGPNERTVNESSVSQVTVNKDLVGNQPRGTEKIKQAVVDFVASLLMPLYKAKKIDKDGYKSIMKKTATKVMEQTTDAEKGMAVHEFLDFKRKNKIRAFVDKLIEKHMGSRPVVKP